MLLPSYNPLVAYKDNITEYPAVHTVRSFSVWEIIGETDWCLSTRAMNIINKLLGDNCTVGDLIDLDWKTISDQKNCGYKALSEIQHFVFKLGRHSLNELIDIVQKSGEHQQKVDEVSDDLVACDKDYHVYKEELDGTKEILKDFIRFSKSQGYKQLVHKVSDVGRFPLGMSKTFVFLAYQEMKRRKHV